MKAKLKKKFQKLLNVVMVVGILVTSFPISPLIQNVHAMSTVSGDKIIEVAQTYKSYTYGGVGTCTGLVTRVLNKLGHIKSARQAFSACKYIGLVIYFDYCARRGACGAL